MKVYRDGKETDNSINIICDNIGLYANLFNIDKDDFYFYVLTYDSDPYFLNVINTVLSFSRSKQ